jgi:tetratricopeptide (TPR) repeat protein
VFAGAIFARNIDTDALSHYNRTEYSAALKLLSAAPADAQNLALAGQCHFMLGDYRKATDDFEKAAQAAPNDASIELWLGRAYGRRAETSFALNAIGFAGKAREAFEKAVQLDPMNRDAVNDLFDFYFSAPPLVGGGKDKARKLLPVIERADPVEWHHALSRLYEDQKRYSEAETELRKAVTLEPNKPGQTLNLAKFLARRGRYDESEMTFEHAERMLPNCPGVIFARAETYVKTQRNHEQARTLLNKYICLSLTPDDPSRTEAEKLLRKLEGV